MSMTVLARKLRRIFLVTGGPLVVAACGAGAEQGPAPLTAAPSAPIQRADLAPPSAPGAPLGTPPTDPLLQPVDPLAPQPPDPLAPQVASEPLPPAPGETQVAAASAAPVQSVGRTDLLGRWTISSGGESCDIYMSLTTWTGGYRASTRGCNTPSLAGISAWDLSGRTVTLKAGDGSSTVASLSASDTQNFSGSTAEGAGITFSR